MMGYQSRSEPKLFYHGINLEQRVLQDHILRKIKKEANFDFIYAEAKGNKMGSGQLLTLSG